MAGPVLIIKLIQILDGPPGVQDVREQRRRNPVKPAWKLVLNPNEIVTSGICVKNGHEEPENQSMR